MPTFLSIGLNGDGFFALFDPATQEISFTRDGSFTMSQFWIPPAEDAVPEVDEEGNEIPPDPAPKSLAGQSS